MPPKLPRPTGRTDPSESDPLDLAERLFGPDPGQEPRQRAGDGDGDEGPRVHPEPIWIRLLGFELPWRRRKRRR